MADKSVSDTKGDDKDHLMEATAEALIQTNISVVEQEEEDGEEGSFDSSEEEEENDELYGSMGPTRRVFIFADVSSFRNNAHYDVSHYVKLMSLATSTAGRLHHDETHGPIWCTSEEHLRQVGDVDFVPHADLLRLHDDNDDVPTDVCIILVGDQSPMTNPPIPFEDLTVTTLRNIALQCSALVLMGTGHGGIIETTGSDNDTADAALIASSSAVNDDVNQREQEQEQEDESRGNEAAFMVNIVCLLPFSMENERFVASGCDLDPGLPDDLDPSSAKHNQMVMPLGTGPRMESLVTVKSAKTQTPAKERRAKERAEQRRKKEAEEERMEKRMLMELYNALIDTRVSAPSRDDPSVTVEDLAHYKPRVIGRAIRPNLSFELQVLNQSRSEDSDVIVVFVEDVGFELKHFLN